MGNLDVGLFLLAYCIVYLCSLVGPFLVAKESLVLIVFFPSGMTLMEDYGNKVRIKVLHCHTINGYYKLYSTLLIFLIRFAYIFQSKEPRMYADALIIFIYTSMYGMAV